MSQHYARGQVERPFQGYPAYGALHEIIPDSRLREFLAKFSKIADGVLDPSQLADDEPRVIDPSPHIQPDDEYDPIEIGAFDDVWSEEPSSRLEAELVEERYDPRKYYRVFDPEKMGVPVVESLPAQKAARAMRTVFESQDFGAVEQDARNAIGRRQPLLYPSLVFNRIEGVGRILPRVPGTAREDDIKQKLALVADLTTKSEEAQATLGQLDFEFAQVTTEITRRLKQYIIPTDYIKHLTFAVLKSSISHGQFVDILDKANEHLAKEPLVIELERDLIFRTNSARKIRHR